MQLFRVDENVKIRRLAGSRAGDQKATELAAIIRPRFTFIFFFVTSLRSDHFFFIFEGFRIDQSFRLTFLLLFFLENIIIFNYAEVAHSLYQLAKACP